MCGQSVARALGDGRFVQIKPFRSTEANAASEAIVSSFIGRNEALVPIPGQTRLLPAEEAARSP